MSWFNVLLATRRRLNNLDDFKELCTVTDSLDDLQNREKRTEIITNYLASKEILLKKGTDLRMYDYILGQGPEGISTKTNEAVEKIFEDINNIDLDLNQAIAYGNILDRIIISNGKYLNRSKRDNNQKSEKVDDNLANTFIQSFETLKKSKHTVRNICAFIYQNGLQNVSYKNIVDNGDSNIFEDVLVAPYIIKQISDVKANDNIFKEDVYIVFSALAESEASQNSKIDSFVADEDFVEALADTEFQKYLPNLTYNTDKADLILESIHTSFKSQSAIGIGVLNQYLKSSEWLKKNAPELENMYKSSSIVGVIDDVVNYFRTNTSDVITNDNIDNIISILDKSLAALLNGYFSLITNINNTISECNKLLATRILINENTIEITLSDCIKRWKDFISSPIYEWNAGKFLSECVQKCAEMVNKNKGKYNPIIDISKPKSKPQIFIMDDKSQQSILRATNVIRSIDISSCESVYESVVDYIKIPEYKNIEETNIYSKIIISKTILDYLTDFFLLKFSEKIAKMENAKTMDCKYFDAVCNIVYRNDKAVDESLNNRYFEEFIMFESFVLNEETDYKSYFNKLANHIQTVLGKNPDIRVYVMKDAKYDDSEVSQDASTGTQDTSTNNQVQAATNNLNNAMVNYNK